MTGIVRACAWVAAGALGLIGCATAPSTSQERADLNTRVQAAIRVAKDTDPGLEKFFDTAAGYAVFPHVGKGAVGIGGAFGRGLLFQGGRPVGYCSLTQATIGAAVGGQAYTEIIFFKTPDAINRFKAGSYAPAAQASAVALQSGAAANAKYASNVLVFTMGHSGLMVEASLGGQRFSFEPLAEGTSAAAPPAGS
jgi:lipid-binding SYLF domain-containing protein